MLQKIKKVIRTYFVIVGVLATVYGVFFLFGAYWLIHRIERDLSDTKTAVKKEAALLVLDVKGPMLTRSISQWELIASRAFGKPLGVDLGRIRAILKQAAEEPLVKGLHLEIGTVSGSLSDFSYLRETIEEFKKSGKPVTASLIEVSNPKLYLASVADRIFLAQAGSVMVPGPSLPLTYFGEALRKVGVDVEIVKAGAFKAAGEPFVRNAPSPEALQMYKDVENSLRNTLIKKIAEGRKRDEVNIRAWFGKAVFTPEEALKVGMIDELAFPENAKDSAEKAVGVKQSISVAKFALEWAGKDTHVSSPNSSHGEGIALLVAEGEITADTLDGESQGITPSQMAKDLKSLVKKDEVKAIVLRINSPGGSATASDLIWKEVRDAAQKKPVIVSMGSVAASGGYYLSMGATKIVAEPTSLTGSIGVIGMFPKLGQFEKKYGVSFHTVTQTDRVALVDMGKPLTPQDREALQDIIRSTYNLFLSRVAEGRKMPIEEVRKLAEGRVYTGATAKEIRLVDEVGGLNRALDLAKEMGGLNPKKLYPLYAPEEERPHWRDIFQFLTTSTQISNWLSGGTQGLVQSAFLKILKSAELTSGENFYFYAPLSAP